MSSDNRIFQKIPSFFIPLILSAVIIALYLIPWVSRSFSWGYVAGIWGFFEIIALLATVSVPVIYGWKTGDAHGAAITGILPVLIVMIILRGISGNFPQTPGLLIEMVIYTGSLCIIGGLEGIFASRRDTKFLGIAFALACLWCFVFLSGIR